MLAGLPPASEGTMPSRNTDPALLPAHVLSAEIGAGRLSPVDIVDARARADPRAATETARLCRGLRR